MSICSEDGNSAYPRVYRRPDPSRYSDPLVLLCRQLIERHDLLKFPQKKEYGQDIEIARLIEEIRQCCMER